MVAIRRRIGYRRAPSPRRPADLSPGIGGSRPGAWSARLAGTLVVVSRREPIDEEGIRARLLQKRAGLAAKVEQLGERDPAEVANLGFGKRIGDGTTYAVERMNDAYQARTLYETVREIDEALARLDAETYGRCVACGGPIPEERLAAVPWAALCVPCGARRPRSRREGSPWTR